MADLDQTCIQKLMRQSFVKQAMEAGAVTRKELEEYVEVAQQAKMGSPEADFEEITGLMLKQFANEERKRVADILREEIKVAEFKKFMQQKAFEDDSAEALKAWYSGTSRLSIEGNLSIDLLHKSINNKWTNQFIGLLQKTGQYDNFVKNNLKREIYQELYSLSAGGKASVSGSDDAFQIAKVIRGLQEQILDSLRANGVVIEELPHYILKQTHDATKIHGDGSEAAKQAWMGFMRKNLDHKQSFNRRRIFTDDDIDADLERAWGNITSGDHHLVDGVGRDIEKAAKVHRTFHFKNANAAFEYDELYGARNLLDSVRDQITVSSRRIALLQKMGSRPEQMHKRLVRLAKLDSKDRGSVENLWKEITGVTSVPGRTMKARVGRNLRALEDMSKLGFAAIASMTDLTTALSVIRSATGKNLVELSTQANIAYLRSLDPIKKVEVNGVQVKERDYWANKFVLGYDSILGETYSKFSVDTPAQQIGLIAKGQRAFFSATGLTAHTNSAKNAIATVMSSILADAAPVKGKLNPRLRATLDRYGIDDEIWAVMNKGKEKVRGYNLLTPEGIRSLPDSEFTKLREKLGKTESQIKEDLENRLAALFNDFADFGSPTPNARTRALINQGRTQDEWEGQLLKSIFQFKSFPIHMYHVASRVALSDPSKSARKLSEALTPQNPFNGPLFKGDVNHFAGLVLGSTMLGYMAFSARELLKGREIPDPKDPQNIARAMLAGGSMGLLGDFVLGEQERFGQSPADMLVGPLLSDAFKAKNIVKNVMTGGFRETESERDRVRRREAAKAMKFLLTKVPLDTVWYTHSGWQHFIVDNAADAVDPGWKGRMRALRRRDEVKRIRGTDYINKGLESLEEGLR